MAVDFDGSAAYLSRASQLFKIEDSQKFTLSAWVLLSGGDASAMYLFSINGDRFSLQRNASDKFVVTGKNSAGSTILTLTSSTSYASGTTWYHVAASGDLSAGTGLLYINRADDEAGAPTLTDDTLDFTTSPLAVGAKSDGTNLFDGELFDLVFWPGVQLDFTDSDELQKIVSSDGLTNRANPGPTPGQPKPVGYGRMPTPSVLFSGTFVPNRGTGGAFVLNGALGASRGPEQYRQSARGTSNPGQRWFDSERSGFSYPRGETFIERREGIPAHGQRLGHDEMDGHTRLERPDISFSRLVFPDREEDTEERDR